MSNLKMRLIDSGGQEMPGMLYGKVLGPVGQGDSGVFIRFTSVPPEIASLLQGLASGLAVEEGHGQTGP